MGAHFDGSTSQFSSDSYKAFINSPLVRDREIERNREREREREREAETESEFNACKYEMACMDISDFLLTIVLF